MKLGIANPSRTPCLALSNDQGLAFLNDAGNTVLLESTHSNHNRGFALGREAESVRWKRRLPIWSDALL